MADEQFNRLTLWVRGISVLLALALLVTDYGFNLWSKAPPIWLYMLFFGMALGIEAKAFRQVALAILGKWTKEGKIDD